MYKALVFGTKDCRFESCQGHGSATKDSCAAKSSHWCVGIPAKLFGCCQLDSTPGLALAIQKVSLTFDALTRVFAGGSITGYVDIQPPGIEAGSPG